MKQLGLGIIVATGLMFPAFGQGVDPLIGSWKLTGTAAFRSLTLTWTGEGQTLTRRLVARIMIRSAIRGWATQKVSR
jgi:hypothetical protein